MTQPLDTPNFFVFDGLDGAGKSTQIVRFQQWLEAQGHAVTLCRDPGTTQLGERLREILLHSFETPISMRAEMFLYMAARAQLVEEIIRTALAAGQTVISDRFLLANVVYQGHAGGLPVETLWQVGEVATGGLQPTLTFVLDVAAEVAASRRQGDPDRLEQRGLDYFNKVRGGFLAEADRAAELQQTRIARIDASVTPDEVAAQIQAAAKACLGVGNVEHGRS